ncbi:alpha-ketoglutarate-dependent dioxygenase alkB homolog 4 isoform X2 [Belonocnema kinseyi]|uniref:alpha-ketoglutarate-dependent dioxygenase alkB homolog 4 isoform X2 n=1 Tax=Belonocnema kinseyi TaxID=2817044 RepID=UPI00143DC24A|nr:alpha-ketoglutarate-dependent dioxygenase alkB homolog 4 isoform X2 [Belonocnema kinseyi]
MESVRPCGCKGIRTCLICEKEYSISKPNLAAELQEDFLSDEEAHSLINDLDSLPWEISQSGRRKQNYGPKCNFKKRRLRLGSFDGFPKTTRFVQEKFAKVPLLENFQTVEQCSLEYNSERGASIDPHIDDCWIWGERIVTVNIIEDSVLSMIPYRNLKKRYNLDYVSTQKLLDGDESLGEEPKFEDIVVRIPMPERSLIVLYGAARYSWEHAVLREDINSRRVCLAYRELTTPYLPNGSQSQEATEILEKATKFWI